MPSDTEVQGRATPGWGEMLRGGNLLRCLVVSAGMILHAINTFIVVTVMPSIVRDIGGMAFFAWSTTLYVVASLLGGAVCARLLHRLGHHPRSTRRNPEASVLAGLCVRLHSLREPAAATFDRSNPWRTLPSRPGSLPAPGCWAR